MKSSGSLTLSTGVRDEERTQQNTNSYGTSFCGPARPRMISAKYRQKEERRKVLKISINKLKKIEDPESSLRRSVLINNTMRRLQREAREEKGGGGGGLIGGIGKGTSSADEITGSRPGELADITNLRKGDGGKPSGGGGSQGIISSSSGSNQDDDVDESDVQAVLSQFYMPLTPRMLTTIDDDDEDGGGSGGPPSAKRSRLDSSSPSSPSLPPSSPPPPPPTPFSSCGHSSVFCGELQSVVYHSLIASLET